MVRNQEREADDEMLRDLLRGQREAVLAAVAGLDEADWHRGGALTTPSRLHHWASTGLVDSSHRMFVGSFCT